MREDEVKRLPLSWARIVLRACWIHVVSIRKFKILLTNEGPQSQLIVAAIETIGKLVDDFSATLTGLVDIGDSYKNLHAAYLVLRDVWERDIRALLDDNQVMEATDGEVWRGPTDDEMDLIRGRLEPKEEGYRVAIEEFIRGLPGSWENLDAWNGSWRM